MADAGPSMSKLRLWKERWSWGAENHIGVALVAGAVGFSLIFSGVRYWRQRQRAKTTADNDKNEDSEEWDSWTNVVKALIALYGSVLYWVGMWSLCVHNLYGEYGAVVQDDSVWAANIAGFFFVGLALALATDSMYALGAIDPRTCIGTDGYSPAAWTKRPGVMTLRIFAGLLATIFMWVGVYFFVSHFVVFDSEDLYNYSGFYTEPMVDLLYSTYMQRS